MKEKLKETTDYFASLYPDIEFSISRKPDGIVGLYHFQFATEFVFRDSCLFSLLPYCSWEISARRWLSVSVW